MERIRVQEVDIQRNVHVYSETGLVGISMVGRTPSKRTSNVIDVSKHLIKQPLPSLPSTSLSPMRTTTEDFTTPLSSFDERIASVVDLGQLNTLIKRYLSSGQFKTALFWADKRLALSHKKGRPLSLVDMAEFINVLATVGDYTRLIAYSQKHELALKHIYFAYFYVNALFKKKYFLEILKLKLASLKGFSDPTEPVAPFMAYLYKMKAFLPNEEEARILDKMSNELKLESGLLLLLGKTYLISQNRHAARLCLQSAVRKDPCAIEAMEIIHKYNLIPKRNFEELVDWFPSLDCGVPNALVHFSIMDGRKKDAVGESSVEALNEDFSVRTAKAIQYYRIGDIYQANKISTQVLEDAGMFQDCILVHVATLVQLRKSDELFILAHQLVDNQPDNELSWYTASRVLEGSFEPLMYVGLEYSYANNTKLAQDFLNDAAVNAGGENPLVLHEQGCVLYMKKDWKGAEEHFTRALRLAYGMSDEDCNVVELLWKPLSEFWEPLINNLGHVERKLGKYLDAVRFHQKATVLCPQKASTIGAMAVAFASAGLVDQATLHFHEALCLSPHDQVLKQGLEKLLECLEANACLSTFQVAGSPANTSHSDTMKFELTANDFAETAEELKLQQKVLETLRRYKTKRRPDVSALRCRNVSHTARQQNAIGESTITEVKLCDLNCTTFRNETTIPLNSGAPCGASKGRYGVSFTFKQVPHILNSMCAIVVYAQKLTNNSAS
ncbi:Cell division cycle protein 16 -like protein [Toxocara canis]|uniref:Cell division cycle protein 16-like protein n=1 Tax=Toxocara canis TaxID=6265 RepID=A0A0B2VMM2_TOXCA|nr:Cell division cycle protein 16 -like protein [Toxocara canis]